MRIILVLIVLVTLSGCAPVFLKKPLSDQEVEKVLSLLKAQEEAADTFFNTGQMVVKDWYWDQEANTLIAGTRTPLRLRIEVTHAWGQPILHLVVVGKSFKALSYGERKLYMGDLAPGALSKFFPADLDADLIWDVVRGFPKLRSGGRRESRTADRLSVLDRNGDESEILDLDPESGLPRQTLFPQRKVGVRYLDFQQEGGILYAGEVRVRQLEGTRSLTLKNGKMVFNKPIPDEIFRMEIPPGFETERIEKEKTD
ncbi:MAG: hypothetical protein MUC98_00815 [Desulfobacterota bacterium]|jgi:hypothetical protein|nr:hypothetical protein [Thermodesulfobacteriota bacterium]